MSAHLYRGLPGRASDLRSNLNPERLFCDVKLADKAARDAITTRLLPANIRKVTRLTRMHTRTQGRFNIQLVLAGLYTSVTIIERCGDRHLHRLVSIDVGIKT